MEAVNLLLAAGFHTSDTAAELGTMGDTLADATGSVRVCSSEKSEKSENVSRAETLTMMKMMKTTVLQLEKKFDAADSHRTPTMGSP